MESLSVHENSILVVVLLLTLHCKLVIAEGLVDAWPERRLRMRGISLFLCRPDPLAPNERVVKLLFAVIAPCSCSWL